MLTIQEQPSTTAKKFERVCDILERHARHPARLIPILQAVQEEYRYLPEEVLKLAAAPAGSGGIGDGR